MSKEGIPTSQNDDQSKEHFELEFLGPKPLGLSPKENLEAILTPEILEKIMSKVQDINELGIAYHSLHTGGIGTPVKESDDEKLASVLRSGILGVTSHGYEISRKERKKKSATEIHADFIRKGEKPNVFFNIVGRLGEQSDYITMRMNSYMFGGKGSGAIIIIFDLSTFKEVISDYEVSLSELAYSNWTHSLHSSREGEIGDYSAPDYGFRLSSRVPPELFKGIVIVLSDGLLRDGSVGSNLQKKLSKVLESLFEADKDNPEDLLPVYDIDGNLLWPELKTHNQIMEELKQKEADRIEQNA
ncbi:MAG: hypothetical protein NTV48_00315 [Candidatus Vogelbacteria bacterium]|nr:hypothetical protein [Candidatus Vogelbacteria bacterium]